VKCPGCGSLDDKVVDSRQSDDGASIRRRRQCLTCSRRYTTFERLEELPLMVLKRSGDRLPFDRSKVVAGVHAAAKARPVTPEAVEALATQVEDHLRLLGGEVTSEQIGLAVLDALRELDPIAYVRFASVYKGFDDPSDFEREVAVLSKATEPKRH
jgi:transcriptional repressor NrdR